MSILRQLVVNLIVSHEESKDRLLTTPIILGRKISIFDGDAKQQNSHI